MRGTRIFDSLDSRFLRVAEEEVNDIPEERWLRGGTPDESRVVPWGFQSIDDEGIDFWQGRLADNIFRWF